MANVELDNRQIEAIKNLENGKILCGGVGSGKSRTALAYYYFKVCGGKVKLNGQGDVSPMKSPRDLYIITTAKKRDTLEWEEEAAPLGISRKREFNPDGIELVVDSWNNINKYSEVSDAVFIFDEQRLVGYGTWVKAFLKIAKANQWILLSATPGDTWTDYIPVFIANGFYKNKTQFLREHAVFNRFAKYPKIDRFVDEQRLLRYRRMLLVDLPYSKHTKRHRSTIKVDYDADTYELVWKKRWNIFTEEPVKQVSELFAVLRKVVYSDHSRVDAISSLVAEHPRLVIFYNFDYELEELRTCMTTQEVTFAEWNGHKHQKIPQSERWCYLVQYTAGAEGWNCTETDTMAFYSLNYSYRMMEQAEGRIDRRNTPYSDLFYYYLRSKAPVDQGVMRAIKTKKKFNEKGYLRNHGIDPREFEPERSN